MTEILMVIKEQIIFTEYIYKLIFQIYKLSSAWMEQEPTCDMNSWIPRKLPNTFPPPYHHSWHTQHTALSKS